ncbi:MAG: peroxiredoxin [Pseudomonadales bacterium]|nr:peroxiredoxin [Pseudomonadales bacterium]MBO6564451.1 peroxiredoxin [Pseudomonadales bacterium]MBO6594503.1 peroxiredoxin [Pseudomonadales bacterium]MBO6656680.1 peroxiredoxin [Pseudomonadales bacterium]MBO6701006.1 peroxiredoxin [Pseudomonadales bacterium]
MLDVGDQAPDFALINDQGEEVSLDDLLAEGPLILYFYPADFTSVCTAEACEIRDHFEDIRSVSANVVGVSPQGEASHDRFRKRYELPFPLLDDRKKQVIKAYGVNGPMGIGVRRVTYLINQEKTIERRVLADFAVKHHVQFIEQVVEDLGGY